LTAWHLVGFVVTLAAVTTVGVYAMRLVRTAADYTVGGRQMGSLLVGTSLVAAFVGGTSVVGTSQAAFQVGVSAIWFTVGAGLGSLVLAAGLAQPLREAMVETVPQFLGRTYGRGAATCASLFIVVGMFLQTMVQVMAAVPLLVSIRPMPETWAAALTMVLVFAYVVGGGFWGASLVGFLKTLILYGTVLAAGWSALVLAGGLEGLRSAFPPGTTWFAFFPKGIGAHGAEIFSVVVGFVSSQNYLQAIFAGRNVRASRLGALLAALLIPLIGWGALGVGMYMRVTNPDINPAGAVPVFFLTHFPAWLGGVGLAGLLVSLVVTGASQLLGMSTTLARDVYQAWVHPDAGDRELLLVSRVLVILIATGVFLFSLGTLQSLILYWAFLSMAIRGVTIFLPMLFAVLWPGAVYGQTGFWAILAAPAAVLLWTLVVPGGLNPLYPGMLLSLLILVAGVGTSCYRAGRPDRSHGQ